MSMGNEAIITAILVTITIAGLGYAFVEPILMGGTLAAKRQQLVAGGTVRRKAVAEAGSRRKQISETLKEIEQRQQRQTQRSLEQRFAAADLEWTKKTFILFSCGIAVFCALIVTTLTGQPFAGLCSLGIGGWLIPNLYINQRIKKRQSQFLEEFPNAIEAIVRGIKSGLPLSDCIMLIANEAKPPVSTEFKSIVEAQSMGMPIPEAVYKVYERTPLVEMSFFAIVIQIQYKSGGNLSEILQNLANVIRERKKMKGKIEAMSAEAISSSVIIGILPIAVAFMSYIGAPDYISLLWQTKSGNIALGAAIGAMLLGSLIMRKMIRFEV